VLPLISENDGKCVEEHRSDRSYRSLFIDEGLFIREHSSVITALKLAKISVAYVFGKRERRVRGFASDLTSAFHFGIDRSEICETRERNVS